MGHRVLLSALAMATVVGVVGCGGASHKHIALPPVNASSDQVVTAYVSALNAHDFHAARAFLTPANDTLIRFRNVRRISPLHMSPFADRLDARRLHYRFGVRVQLMNTDPRGLAFLLVRNRRNERWRIGDQGTF